MKLKSLRGMALVTATLWMPLAVGAQTSLTQEYLPPPDPGYGLYYHGNQGLIEKATRWGYHDGWKQGHEDRGRAHDSDPKGSDYYQRPPQHGNILGLSRGQYERVYQSAFLHGYDHGYRL